MLAFVLILLIIFVTPIFVLVFLYNRLITLRNQAQKAWYQIEVQLQRRADLIPNLVETVKGYASHERGVFEQVSLARSQWQSAGTVKEKAEATNQLDKALKSLFAVAENYPDLKANQNFLLLQEKLFGIEAQIASSRQFYNEAVLSLNNAQQTFPSNMIANLFGFKPREYFETEEPSKRTVPKVDFKS